MVVDKCLHKVPAERYPTVSELEADVKRLVEETGPRPAAGGVSAYPGRYRRLTVRFALLAIAIILLWLIPSNWNTVRKWMGIAAVPAEKHLVVLPFTNIGGDPENQAFSDGLVETLTSKLTQLEQFQGSLWVVPASDVRQRGITSASEARRAFGANLVVSGSVQRLENDLRLTLNLVDSKSLRQLVSEVITEQVAHLAALQDGIVTKLGEMLNVELHPESRAVLAAGGTAVPEAYDFYIQGKGYLSRYEKVENLNSAIDLFEKAIERDSLYALAYSGLGEAYWRKFEESKDTRWVEFAVSYSQRAARLNDLLSPVHITLGMIYTGTEAYEKAIQEFERALAVDRLSAEAYRNLAKAYEGQGRLKEAESTYQRAIELKPDYWAGYNVLGVFYYRHGRYEEAIRQFRQVVVLTPDNYRGYSNLGGIYYLLGRFTEAREMFERSREINPSYQVLSNLGTLYYMEGRYADAARMYEQALEINDRDYQIWGHLAVAYYWAPGERGKADNMYQRAAAMAEERRKVTPRDPELLSNLVGYYIRLAQRAKAIQLLEQVLTMASNNPDAMYRVGHAYEQLGRRELALEWIGKALQTGHSLSEIMHEPGLRQLRADERFP
ncbi:MAG: tetratricopeptide repeat protein, partial [Anaerolineales bacterium]